MKLMLCVLGFLPAVLHAGWTIQNIPTAIEPGIYLPYWVLGEFSSAYRPVYDASGVKTGENIAVAYRSKYLWVIVKQGAVGWDSRRFDDNGRYPSMTLDDQGGPHMSYFRTSNKKLYYAHKVPDGTGNCGSMKWACEEVPSSPLGPLKGRSAIAIVGQTVHLLVEAPWDAPNGSSVFHYTKQINGVDWTLVSDRVSYAYQLTDLSLRVDNAGNLHALIEGNDEIDWFRKTSTWMGVGFLMGNGSLGITGNGAPRICYRDVANRLIYARSNGTEYWTESILDHNIGDTGACAVAVPQVSGIQLPGSDGPRMVYYDEPTSELKYVTPNVTLFPQPGGPWTISTVGPALGAWKVDLHLDKQSRPTIIFFDVTENKMRFAQMQ